jgi:tetrapyrrole methylase family protein/MazG family protein
MTFSLSELRSVLAALNDRCAFGPGPALDSLQIITASHLATQHYPHLDPGQPALLIGLDNRALAQQVQSTLLAAYPPDHPVILIADNSSQTLPLAQLAGMFDLTRGACLLIPALSAAASGAALQDVVAHLRAPDGCPWDRELTWGRLRSSLLEESYELLAALDAEDAPKVAEELGDLLLQIALLAQIAAEQGLFRLPVVIQGIVSKLVRRHPHVFGDEEVSGTAEVLANWEAIKRAERANNGEQRSPLAGVPAGLPALAQAQAYLDRMSRLAAIDVPAAPWGMLANLPEGAVVPPELLGEALFGLVAWAWQRHLDAESALRTVNARYAAAVAQAEDGDPA